MRPLRALAIILLIAGGVGASALLIAKEARSLHSSPLFRLPATGLFHQSPAPATNAGASWLTCGPGSPIRSGQADTWSAHAATDGA